MMRLIAISCDLVARVTRRVSWVFLRARLRRCGRRTYLDPRGIYSWESISVGSDVFVAPGAFFSATVSAIEIGDKVMMGPGVTILGGDHNTSVVGKAMCDITEKRPEDDAPVVIEDDVWIGARAVLLKGVRVSRGSIVAAGAVVTKSFPPYSIIGGVPARLLRPRWDEATIRRHEDMLYPPDGRVDRQ